VPFRLVRIVHVAAALARARADRSIRDPYMPEVVRLREAADMPVRIGRLRNLSRTIVRLSVLFAALLILVPIPDAAAAAAPSQDDSEVAGAFQRRLFEKINLRRSVAGTQRLAFVPASASAALDGFLAAAAKANAWPAGSVCALSPWRRILLGLGPSHRLRRRPARRGPGKSAGAVLDARSRRSAVVDLPDALRRSVHGPRHQRSGLQCVWRAPRGRPEQAEPGDRRGTRCPLRDLSRPVGGGIDERLARPFMQPSRNDVRATMARML
jgi:hypothetical protein